MFVKTTFAALALSTGVLLSAQAARAADPYVVPAYDWSGFYSGVHVGHTWADGPYDAPGIPAFVNLDMSSVSFGTLNGYNYQTGDNLVFGFESDSTFHKLNDQVDPLLDFTVKMEGSLRARMGFAHDRFLPFVTAGIGLARGKAVDDAVGSDKQYHLGLVAGAGLEYALADQFRIRSEYLYKNYGKETYNLGGFVDTVKWDEHIVRAALIYAW